MPMTKNNKKTDALLGIVSFKNNTFSIKIEKKHFIKEKYDKIKNSESFKKVYNNSSVGDLMEIE